MPEKKDPYSTYGLKLIRLFARMMFSNRRYSLTELARIADCSKQSVIRLIGDMRDAYGVRIDESTEGKQKYYQISILKRITPVLPLTESELIAMQMCKTFTEHLLGDRFDTDATHALEKNLSFISRPIGSPSRHFASFSMGTIDYTPHQENIHILIDAMNEQHICQITYQAILEQKAKTFYILPLKIFSYRDTLYLHARLAAPPGKDYGRAEFDPLLAVHRLKNVEKTDRPFEYPADYDFEAVFTKKFGIIKSDAFGVEVEFSGWAALHVAERTWSEDQKITQLDDHTIRLTFSCSSDIEIIPWVLSFGGAVKVIQPDWLKKEILDQVNKTAALYDEKTDKDQIFQVLQ
jgi:predicted DNA-binding transcriptional regulator YafY